MTHALSFFESLHADDVNWILSTGREEQIITSTVVIRAGEVPTSVFVVLNGLLSVEVPEMLDSRFRGLGPGEMVGEMSMLDGMPANVSVVAAENSLLLALPHSTLLERVKSDPAFAARFYRAIALVAVGRVRTSVGVLAERLEDLQQGAGAASEIRHEMVHAISRLKDGLGRADTAARTNGGEIPEGVHAEMKAGFRDFCVYIDEQLFRRPDVPETIRNELGAQLRRDLLPYLLLTDCARRFYEKPRGYAGDFFSIETIYAGVASGRGSIGKLIDACFLAEPAAVAVQNRRGLLTAEIQQVLDTAGSEPVQICSLASGPAAEIFDVFETIDEPKRLVANLIDIDLQALAFVSDKATQRGLKRQFNPNHANLVYLATGRKQLSFGVGQKLVYSIGLIDYFADEFVVSLLNYCYDLLAPGGKVILGNFHPRNTSRALMEYILDWKLIHRDEEDMNRLMTASRFGRPCTEILFEDTGVNMFAACLKG